MTRVVPPAAVLAAIALGLGAPGAGAQVTMPELPDAPETAPIPHESAISEQYQEVEAAVAEALPAAPAPPAPAPEPVVEAPPPTPAGEQYHSETPSHVSVTQTQPSNVNVSIRINSPGDDGPVVQINNAGGSAVVEAVQESSPKPAQPDPASRPEPAPSAMPETWEWVWTSACFGGAPRARAAAVPDWSWRWSCEEGVYDPDGPVAVPAMPDAWGFADEVLATMPVPGLDTGSAPTERESKASSPRAGPPDRRAHRPAAVAAVPAAGGPPVARPLVAAATQVPPAVAEQVSHVVRAAARARPGPADESALVAPPLGGPTALGASGLSAVASVLLGIWLAVLVTPIVLVLPRLRRRRRSGPAWRLKRPPSSRLERPG